MGCFLFQFVVSLVCEEDMILHQMIKCKVQIIMVICPPMVSMMNSHFVECSKSDALIFFPPWTIPYGYKWGNSFASKSGSSYESGAALAFDDFTDDFTFSVCVPILTSPIHVGMTGQINCVEGNSKPSWFSISCTKCWPLWTTTISKVHLGKHGKCALTDCWLQNDCMDSPWGIYLACRLLFCHNYAIAGFTYPVGIFRSQDLSVYHTNCSI